MAVGVDVCKFLAQFAVEARAERRRRDVAQMALHYRAQRRWPEAEGARREWRTMRGRRRRTSSIR